MKKSNIVYGILFLLVFAGSFLFTSEVKAEVSPNPYQIINLEPGWNIVSTPRVLLSQEFSVPETTDYIDIYLLDPTSSSGWTTMQEIGQTKLEPLYAYFINNKTSETQTLKLNYNFNLTPDQRLFQRTLQPGWNAVGVALPDDVLGSNVNNVGTNEINKILNLINGSMFIMVDFTAGEESIDSVKISDTWETKVNIDREDLGNFRKFKGYAVFVTETTNDYIGFQNIDDGLKFSLTNNNFTGAKAGSTDKVLLSFQIDSLSDVDINSLIFTHGGTGDESNISNFRLYDADSEELLGSSDDAEFLNLAISLGSGHRNINLVGDISDAIENEESHQFTLQSTGIDKEIVISGLPISNTLIISSFSEVEEIGKTVGNFSISNDEVCMEDGKPIIYFFGSGSCPHCQWEYPIIQDVVAKFGDHILFHDNIDSNDDESVFNRYSENGYVPAIILGCKYYRVGSGENVGEDQEVADLTELICNLTDNQPVGVCQPQTQSPALVVITAGTPVASNVVANAQNVTFAYFDIDTSGSGEDIKVTQVVTFDTTDGTTPNLRDEDIVNLELWGDPDTTDGINEFIRLETSTSTATQSFNGLTTFTFKTPIKINKGTTSRLTLIADVSSGATVMAHQHLIDGVNATVTSTGWSTGTAIDETYSGAGQAQTIAPSGSLKIIASADKPAKAQFVAGTTGNVMMSYNMYATNEDVSITKLYIATGPNDTNSRSAINRVKLFYEGNQVGASSGYALNATGYAVVSLSAGEIVVPKDTWTNLTIKVDFNDKSQVTDGTTLEIGLGDDSGDDSTWSGQDGTAIAGSYKVTAYGLDSGTTLTETNIDSLGTGDGTIVASYQHKIYKGLLIVSKNSSSPSGTATAGAGKEVLRLDLEAIGDRITVNELEFCVVGTATGITGTGSVTLKDVSQSTTYATITQSGYDAYWDNLKGAGTYYPMDPIPDGSSCFSFGSNTNNIEPFTTTLQINEGTTKTIKLFGDTTGAAATKSLQVSLKPNPIGGLKATTSGIDWSNTAGTSIDEVITKNTPVTGGALSY